MKKYFYILAALSLAPTFALAQSLENDVDSELDQAYSAPVQRATTEQQAPVQQAPRRAQQPIYILNQAPVSTSTSSAQVVQAQPQVQTVQQQPVQQVVQKQPTTEIVASPLAASHAEEIRAARQNAEVNTEQKIVEKLEESRMDDEKKRADVLFGDKFKQLKQDDKQQAQVVQQDAYIVPAPAPIIQPVIVQPAPVQVIQQPVPVAPAPVVAPAPEPKENTRDIIREELAASRKSETVVEEAPVSTKYFGLNVGVGNYPSENLIKGNYDVGLSFGSRYDNFIVEGTLSYANYSFNAYNVAYNGGSYSGYSGSGFGSGSYGNMNVNQYAGALAGKFQLLTGMIRPVIGAVAQYSYRTYNMTSNNFSYSNNGGNAATSQALDAGALAGVDLEISPKYTIGLDFRYMWNVSNSLNVSDSYSNGAAALNYNGGIEQYSYYVTTLSGRMNF